MIVALESPPPAERSGTPLGLRIREELFHQHSDSVQGGQKRRHEHVGQPQVGFGIDSSLGRTDIAGGVAQGNEYYHHYSQEIRAPLSDYTQHSQQKRTRLQGSSCLYQEKEGSLGISHFTKNSETLLKALQALFPRMSDESIAHVLEECGDDIDAAIRRLNDLQLSTPSCSTEAVGKSVSRGETLQNNNRDDSNVVRREWVDALVEQMSVATDVDDAKERAAQVLQRALVNSQQEAMDHVDSVQKENSILKRAVGIQNTKIHELMEERKNVDQLLSEVNHLKEKCHALEMHNYSLQLHLKQATTRQDECRTPGGGPNNPDVF